MGRWIAHVDMDAFYAAVEQRDRPELRGRPVIVGGSPDGRGVVSAASYEARRYGVRSAMPTRTALRLCPRAVVLPVRMVRYREESRRMFALLEQYSPLIEPLSIDEAFLDLTGTEALFGPAEDTARRLKRHLREELDLTASVGLAPNKFLAKLASDLEKPDGLVILRPEEVAARLAPLPVERLWGVGPATLRRLHRLGFRTVGEVRARGPEPLIREFGAAGEQFHRLAMGEDDRPVEPEREARSLGHEVTFPADVEDAEFLRALLLHQTEDVAYRLRRLGRLARTVTLKLRYADFTTLTRSRSLPEPTEGTQVLWEAAGGLFDRWRAENRSRSLRLLGMSVSQLVSPEARQLSLFDTQDERSRRLDAAVDALRERFGPNAVRRRLPRSEE